MNEMYKYLEEHNYISKNENKDPLRQQELSISRAKCIANKYINLVEKLQQENKQLKDNWNKLKEWLNVFHKLSEFQQWEIVDKMQELEQGSDNNESI